MREDATDISSAKTGLTRKEFHRMWVRLPNEQRTRVRRAVVRGKAVTDEAGARVAVEFARRWARAVTWNVTILAVGYAAVLWTGFARPDLGTTWWNLAVNAALLVLAPMAVIVIRSRCREAERRNQAVADGGSAAPGPSRTNPMEEDGRKWRQGLP